MKKLKAFFLAVFFGGSFLIGGNALAVAFEINQFTSEIEINEDSSIIVQETIEVNFLQQRHGIFRDIPIKYEDEYKQRRNIDLDVLSVVDENGAPWMYETSRSGGDIRIKIGDPDVFVFGEQTYRITYQVKRALGYFETQDELYWNVTGHRWDAPIHSVEASVAVPFDDQSRIQTKCYTGPLGSTAENCSITKSRGLANFTANEFLTVVVGWPKGYVDEPSTSEKIGYFVKDNYGYSFPVFVFVIMYLIWLRHGKDPKDPPGLVTQFDPPDDLTPAETGYLVYQKMKNEFLTAELVNLAVKGYIKIKEYPEEKNVAWRLVKPREYELFKLKEADDELKEHEKMILEGIFLSKTSRKVSRIPVSFQRKVKDIRKTLYKQLKNKKYFDKNPVKVRGFFTTIAIFIFYFSFFLVGVFVAHLFIGVLLSAVVIFIFSFVMAKRTHEGVLANEHTLGFKKYIENAEQHRVKWEEKKNIFFEFLPYAMVFGVAEKWAEVFKDTFKEAPEWYEGSDPAGFNASAFTSSMGSFSSSTISSVAPRSSSSGFSGGSSGGGGGGGGGGSW